MYLSTGIGDGLIPVFYYDSKAKEQTEAIGFWIPEVNRSEIISIRNISFVPQVSSPEHEFSFFNGKAEAGVK